MVIVFIAVLPQFKYICKNESLNDSETYYEGSL
jgi:hypothetical protein